ncbi:MAG: SprT-like domain-containing protein [Fimbriimonas sp.]
MLRELAEQHLDDLCARFPLGYRPVLLWKALRVSAGLAYYKEGRIALSSIVLTDEANMRETLTHEYAHLLAVFRHGQKGAGHGAPWKKAMLDLGLEPKVRHRFEVQRNTPRQKVVYRCKKCQKLIERSRRLPRRRVYVHSGCGGAIKLEAVLAR